ncbi:MAG: hypothetical protein Q9174_001337 [Haloplaca sp. 1 TL-2023]
MPLYSRPTQRWEEETHRIFEELHAMEQGAGDEIFQTRAWPSEDSSTRNVAIDLTTAQGREARDGVIRYRLSRLLPVEMLGASASVRGIPVDLIDEIVSSFQEMAGQMFLVSRTKAELWELITDVWGRKDDQFSDQLLRRLRPWFPESWKNDCWIAQCIIPVICDKYQLSRDDVSADPNETFVTLKKDIGSRFCNRAAWELVMLTVYLAVLSSELAAFLPFELMYVQAEIDPTVAEAFMVGQHYTAHWTIGPLMNNQHTKRYFDICYGHVLAFLDSKAWFDGPWEGAVQRYYDGFFGRLDYRLEIQGPFSRE